MSPHRWRPHAAFVLAAGLGTRMRHLTESVPKPMVPLLGVTLIDRVLDQIADAGISTAVVNVHYMADVLEAHLAQRTRPRIQISDERGVLLETGGGVMKAWPQLSAGPFLIHNSDSVWIEGVGHNASSMLWPDRQRDSSLLWRERQRNLDRLCDGFDPDRMDSLMLLAPTAQCLGYDGAGDFDMDGSGRLVRRMAGQTVPYVFAGVQIAHPRLFDDAPQGKFSLNKVWDRSIASGRLYGLRLEGTWMHVGTPEAVIEAEQRMTLEQAS